MVRMRKVRARSVWESQHEDNAIVLIISSLPMFYNKNIILLLFSHLLWLYLACTCMSLAVSDRTVAVRYEPIQAATVSRYKLRFME